MSVPPPHKFKKFSKTSTDTAWKAVKTDSIRDKWHTELGEALRAAQPAYDKINFVLLDVGLMTAATRKFDLVEDVEAARDMAKEHYDKVVKPAIKAMEKAHSKAVWAGRNLVISKASNTKAKQIAADLGPRLTQLKGIHLKDFDAEILRLQKNMKFTFDHYAANMKTVLKDANAFIDKVKQNPTRDEFNTGIEAAARGLTQMIGQAEKLRKNGFDLGKPYRKDLFDALDDWANGRDKLGKSAGQINVMAAIGKFELIVDDIEEWWN